MHRILILAAALVAIGAAPVSAQVGAPGSAQVPANGFRVKHEISINASAEKVYDALVAQVGMWWSPQHTFSGDSKNLSLEARPGGCFCEKLENGGALEHLRVVYVAPGEMLRLSGALGPLQAWAVTGSLTWRLTNAEGGSTVELSYVVGGYMEGGFEAITPGVRAVLLEQLRRLKSFVETGKPTQTPGQ